MMPLLVLSIFSFVGDLKGCGMGLAERSGADQAEVKAAMAKSAAETARLQAELAEAREALERARHLEGRQTLNP
jgi:hypothetical protein